MILIKYSVAQLKATTETSFTVDVANKGSLKVTGQLGIPMEKQSSNPATCLRLALAHSLKMLVQTQACWNPGSVWGVHAKITSASSADMTPCISEITSTAVLKSTNASSRKWRGGPGLGFREKYVRIRGTSNAAVIPLYGLVGFPFDSGSSQGFVLVLAEGLTREPNSKSASRVLKSFLVTMPICLKRSTNKIESNA